MPSEFELIFEEFSDELDALVEMASPGANRLTLSPKARIAASNGAILLLAANFEEFVRQLVKAAFAAKAKKSKTIADFPPKIAGTVWRRSLELLARTPFDEIEANAKLINYRLGSVIAFSIDKNHAAEVGDALAHNENNMRPDQLNGLFNGIGVNSVCSRVCEKKAIIDHLGCNSAGTAHSEFRSRLDDFFRRRNITAHAIRSGTSSGPIDLQRDIDLLRVFSRTLSATLEDDIIGVRTNSNTKAGGARKVSSAKTRTSKR